MQINEYQDATGATYKFGMDDALQYLTIGLNGEAGEVAEFIKKGIFHGKGLDYHAIALELGDVLWYTARLADAIGYSLSDVAQMNLDKLKERHG